MSMISCAPLIPDSAVHTNRVNRVAGNEIDMIPKPGIYANTIDELNSSFSETYAESVLAFPSGIATLSADMRA